MTSYYASRISPVILRPCVTKVLYQHSYKQLYKYFKYGVSPVPTPREVEYVCYSKYSTVVLPREAK